jgi:FkbM family methyltransferase
MIDFALVNLIKKHSINGVLDIGANTGEYAINMHSIFPSLKILSIEANPSCSAILETNLGDICEIEYIISCLSDGKKETIFYGTTENPTSTGNSLYRENTKHYSDEKITKSAIQTETLDELLNRTGKMGKYQFMKIDTQGSELDILKGATETLKYVKLIVAETSILEYTIGSPLQGEIVSYLQNCGFRVLGSVEDHRLNGGLGALFQQDLLFEKD